MLKYMNAFSESFYDMSKLIYLEIMQLFFIWRS